MLAAPGAPGSLVRVVGAGGCGKKESEKDDDHEERVHWVFLTYTSKDYLMEQLKRGYWKLHLQPGHLLSDGVTDDMIVFYGSEMLSIPVEHHDDGDLQPSALPPSALPPSALPPVHVEPSAPPAASADSGDVIDTTSDDEIWALVT